jgi:hypothetical protein
VEGFLVLAFLLVLFVAGVTAFIDTLRHSPAEWQAVGRSQGLTLALIVCACGVGGIYYWIGIRPSLRRT